MVQSYVKFLLLYQKLFPGEGQAAVLTLDTGQADTAGGLDIRKDLLLPQGQKQLQIPQVGTDIQIQVRHPGFVQCILALDAAGSKLTSVDFQHNSLLTEW